MNENGFDVLGALLETCALRIAPASEVFWYTSGTVGPYYVNTQNLYGSPRKAAEMLDFIESGRGDKVRFPGQLLRRIRTNYAADPIYRSVIDALVQEAGQKAADVDYVSGGERRDWFFSLAVADLVGKPHLTIYKDLSMVVLEGTRSGPAGNLAGRSTLHIADLVTEASSYFRAWIPAVRGFGGRIAYSLNVVDRGQGGSEALCREGVQTSALLRLDEHLFDSLLRAGHIDSRQRRGLGAYFRDPYGSMKKFLEEHPDFLRHALKAAEPITGRARILVEKNPYHLDLEKVLA